MPLAMTRAQEYRLEILAKHCFEQILPAFTAEAKPGDIVVAGRNFGHGNPHIQGFLGLKGRGVGLVIASISRGPLRACINAGVPLLQLRNALQVCENGDLLRVNWRSGRVENLRTGKVFDAPPMPALMRDIVQAGGGIGYMVQRLREAALQGNPQQEGDTP